MNLGKFVVQKNFISKLYLNQVTTTGLIIVSFFLACVGSGWGGDFKIWFLKISIHNLKNLEISLWLLLFSKVIILYYLSGEKKKDIYRTNKISPVFNYFGCFLVIIALVILYRKTIGNYFIADDCLILQDVKKGFYNSVLVMPKFAWRFRVVRPIAFLTWFLNYKMFSIHPFGWYLTNLFLHFISFFVAILLVKAITSDMFVAVIAGSLFAISPIHHEVINWIATRADLICGLFYFISLYTYITFRKSSNKQYGFFAASLVSFILALLSKESAISLPIIIIICELFLSKNIKQGLKSNFRLFVFYFVSLLLYLIMRYFVYGTINVGAPIGGASKLLLENIPEYLRGAFLGLFIPMFFPINWFSVSYFNLNWVHYLSFFNSFILCLLIILNIKKILHNRAIIFSVLFIIFTTGVLLNIWDIGTGLHGSRYYYFISFGFFLFIAGICLLGNRSTLERRINSTGIVVVFCCSLVFLWVNNLSWEKAGKLPFEIIRQTKSLYPDFKNKKDGRLFYYGIPRVIAGVVIYSWDPEVITEQLSHFYDSIPNANVVRHRGILIDLNQVNLDKDIILEWNERQEKLYDLTSDLKQALKTNKVDYSAMKHILSSINNINLWDKNEQIIEIEKGKHFRITGLDGFFFSKEFDIPAKKLPYLTVKMEVIPKSERYYSGAFSGKLYWKTDKVNEFREDRFVEFWLNPQKDYEIYYIYFISPEEVLNNENITQLKFMPTFFPSDVYIDYIELRFDSDSDAHRPFYNKIN